jgi:hypothetical protein
MRLRDAMQRAMALVGDEQGKGGHVGFLARVCRVSARVQKLAAVGDARSAMLCLTLALPTRTSQIWWCPTRIAY